MFEYYMQQHSSHQYDIMLYVNTERLSKVEEGVRCASKALRHAVKLMQYVRYQNNHHQR